jgi:hypothetical protein|tara:strand:- start:430 stop:531 length:102 start_codon:yes stop_codon:yes gene_type:complete
MMFGGGFFSAFEGLFLQAENKIKLKRKIRPFIS